MAKASSIETDKLKTGSPFIGHGSSRSSTNLHSAFALLPFRLISASHACLLGIEKGILYPSACSLLHNPSRQEHSEKPFEPIKRLLLLWTLEGEEGDTCPRRRDGGSTRVKTRWCLVLEEKQGPRGQEQEKRGLVEAAWPVRVAVVLHLSFERRSLDCCFDVQLEFAGRLEKNPFLV